MFAAACKDTMQANNQNPNGFLAASVTGIGIAMNPSARRRHLPRRPGPRQAMRAAALGVILLPLNMTVAVVVLALLIVAVYVCLARGLVLWWRPG
jgi:hypothetical protein